ncbi:MAG: shikimate dehydrogenase family protein [Acholeplasmataceae bacterium]
MTFGLLGKDIAYSQSPKIFKQIQLHTGQDLNYQLFDVEPHEISNYMEMLKNGEIQGLQVTKPYKELVIDHCDMLSPSAQKIGSVNTMYLRNGKIIGDNTDAYGFEALLASHHIILKNKNICMFGNGGAAKSVYYVLKKQGIEPLIFKRVSSKRAPISKNEHTYEDSNIQSCDIIIQTTSHDFDQNHLQQLKDMSCQPKMVIDLIYYKKTALMSIAEISYDGLIMLIYQAIKSYELFTGDTMDHISEVIETLKGVLS